MRSQPPQGFILIISVLVLSTLLVAGSYLAITSVTEHKISSAEGVATKTYYHAEAAAHEMMWKMKYDDATRDAFLAGTLSSSFDIARTDVFGDPRAAYTASAQSLAPAEASITATSTYQLNGATSRRVIKTYVSRATDNSGVWDYALFAGGRGGQQNGNFTFTGSGIVLTANDSHLHANQVFKVQGAEVIINDGKVSASNVISVVAGGTLTLNNSTQEAPTSTIDMLQIDFDSTDPDSWKNRATVTYTQAEFSALPNNTTLNGIIFVNGNANILGKTFTINGVLVATGDITITTSGTTLTVNADATYGGGLLAKDDIAITTSGGTFLLNGLAYAADRLDITSSATTFTINGAMAGFDARVTASGGGITINYSTSTFNNVIVPEFNPSSPLIQIDHWEEQY